MERDLISPSIHPILSDKSSVDNKISATASPKFTAALTIRQPFAFEFLGLNAKDVELKNDEFRHEYLGQLNAYVSYYKENEMYEGDNPPVGILLCTRKGEKMVEYAIAGMDNHLFVSTYMLQLPDKTTLENFLLKELKEQKEE